MTEQIRAAGELDDGTVPIEQRPAPQRCPTEIRYCENCGAVLAGPYCSQCGQRHHDHPVHHFWHFISEAAEDLTHADSRLWQTLRALLFRPGFLTREFLDGRRVRYLPPVRLYLVVSVIFFLIVGVHSQLSRPAELVFSSNGKSFHYQVIPAHQRNGPATAVRAIGGVATGRTALARAQTQMQRSCKREGRYVEQHGGWLDRFGPQLEQSCLAVAAAGGQKRLQQSIEHNLERAMFLLLPLLALLMKPLYFKPPRHYIEHMLFLLHNHAFLFVILTLSTLLEMITSSSWVLDPVDMVMTVGIPVYFYLAMRRVYGQSRRLTFGKLAGLGIGYFFLGVLMFTITISYSILML